MTNYLIVLNDVQTANLFKRTSKKKESWALLPDGEMRFFKGAIPAYYTGSFQKIGDKRVFMPGIAVAYNIVKD